MKTNKREQVFALLFEASFHGNDMDYVASCLDDGSATAGVLAKSKSVCGHIEEIDGRIESRLRSWDIKRISRVALSAMRLAVYEMLFEDTTPNGAAVNEAVELCRKYASDDEASFANGILRAISADLSQGSPASPDTP